MEDFCQCTPFEFYSIYEGWQRRRESEDRSAWERARMICMCSLQPYTKKSLSPKDVMEFPWEHELKETPRREERKEDILARYQAAKKRVGLT
jgi:hypothetical protein